MTSLRSLLSSNLTRQFSNATAATRASSTQLTSRFAAVPKGPEDAILGVTVAYKADPNPKKINLGVGAYRDDNGKPVVLSAVRAAEARLATRNLPMEYLPVAGSTAFTDHAVRLAYGDANQFIQQGHVAKIQTLSGTGACRMAGVFASRFLTTLHGEPMDKPRVLLPDPSWANHANIFRDAGCDVGKYAYYDPATRSLDFDGCIRSLQEAPDGTIVLLHACAHNPTGVDPTLEQWTGLSAVMREKRHLPLFDMAYQGFTSGDMDTDAASLRTFVDDGHRIMLAQSFSKNFGLYGQRVGCLSVLTDSKEEAVAIDSQLKILARPMYSNPPITGVRIVEEILSDTELDQLWRTEMKGMADRINSMRTLLKGNLEGLGSVHSWKHIVDQNGMFCYSGLTQEQVAKLREDHSVYLTSNGRISMAGVTTQNVEYLANAVHSVTK